MADLEKDKNGLTRKLEESHSISLSSFQGPLPPPQLLAAFENVLPGLANRITLIAEKEQIRRHDSEKSIELRFHRIITMKQRGQIFSFILAFILMIGSLFLIHEGKTTIGVTALLIELAGIVALFLYSEYQKGKKKSLESTSE